MDVATHPHVTVDLRKLATTAPIGPRRAACYSAATLVDDIVSTIDDPAMMAIALNDAAEELASIATDVYSETTYATHRTPQRARIALDKDRVERDAEREDHLRHEWQ